MTCSQPGCSGAVVDGYCDVCGMAASTPAAPPSATGASAVPTGNGANSVTQGSRRLASAPIGSSRRTASTPTRRLAGVTRRVSRIGAGITSVPPTPVTNPLDAVMADPQVAEDKRYCPSCNAPVGRGRGGQPGRTEGFCPKCRARFSFAPKLHPGDLVGGQYEVVGCLAHGGLGWIYLARDKNVSDRFVALKGLLNSGDADAYQAAIAERQFLAEVQHPLIVEIYNFVTHDDAGYTVMEYVGGKSLKQLLRERRAAGDGAIDPLPVDQAAAYIIEILPALGYLHTLGLLYCDFKPDNVIQEGDSLSLIDLGGVRRADDTASAIYGTVGFQAPEIASLGPSVASDVFTIGRTLAVLSMDFRGYQSTYVSELPSVDDVELFQRHDSLYRFLLKSTAPDPNDRFQSADEMREQLVGVLREIVAAMRPAASRSLVTNPSSLFIEPSISSSAFSWRDLPTLRQDPNDAATAWLQGVSIDDPVERLAALDVHMDQTREVALAAILGSIEADATASQRAAQQARPQTQHRPGGRPSTPLPTSTSKRINAVLDNDPWEWRAIWLAGIAALAEGNNADAVSSFNAVYGQVPGELAPKLALAHACEVSGELANAVRLYETCARTDAAYAAPACFGLARIHASTGDLAAALDALDRIPSTSRAFVEARRARIDLQLDASPSPAVLSSIAAETDELGLDTRDRSAVRLRIFEAALVAAGAGETGRVGDVELSDVSVRQALDRELRQLAQHTDDPAERVRLVDRANRIRPRTLV